MVVQKFEVVIATSGTAGITWKDISDAVQEKYNQSEIALEVTEIKEKGKK